MKKLFLYTVLLSFFLTTSCEKDELTKPVKVDFDFAMEAYHSGGGGGESKSEQAFDIDEGTIVVNAIEFDGRRDQGKDYFFTSHFEIPLQAEMHTGNTNQNISFDIPQGVYTRVDLVLSFGNEEQESIWIKGMFAQGPVDEIPVWFEYNFQEQIRIRAKNTENSDQIVIKKGNPPTATVLLDADFLFRIVNVGLIQAAEVVKIENNDVILINSEYNTNIFSLLVARLDNAIRVIFE